MLPIFHHGSPGAAVPFPTFTARRPIEASAWYLTRGRGLGSTRTRAEGGGLRGDVALLADHLDAERFLVAGWSGADRTPRRRAALMPERVMAAATTAGVAPYDADGLEWTAGAWGRRIDEYPLAATDLEAHLAWMWPHAEALALVTAA